MKQILLCTLLTLTTTGITAQNVIWFSKPTSLKGRAAWYEGHPERFDSTHKPVGVGNSMQNSDPEWETRSLPLGNGSIGCNVMGSVRTDRYTLN